MPLTQVLFYQETEREVPVLDWLTELEVSNPKAHAKCLARIRMLEESGHQLRRPYADSIGHGLYELRARHGNVHYRMLYSFYGTAQSPLLHGCTKERALPAADVQRALERKLKFERDPKRHTYKPGGR